MTDRQRWRYGDTNPVVAAVDSATVIEVGDILWQDIDDAKPASMVPSDTGGVDKQLRGLAQLQEAFAGKFLGVATDHSRDGDTAPVHVRTTGVFEFGCPSGTFELGDLIGSRPSDLADEPGRLLNQDVVKVSQAKYAIARVAKFEHQPVTSVLIDIRSRVMGYRVE